jgi:Na+-transporting methylmalonyl-CoA/oxaloacetate decarboxylase gamma subunit
MSLAFGLYITVLGVGFVFFTLLSVGVLSKLLTFIFQNARAQNVETIVNKYEDTSKIAAVAAVIATIGSEYEQVMISMGDDNSRWRAVAKSEVMERL